MSPWWAYMAGVATWPGIAVVLWVAALLAGPRRWRVTYRTSEGLRVYEKRGQQGWRRVR